MNLVDEMQQRLATLEPRERRFLLVGAAAIFLGIVFFGLVQPLHRYHDGLENKVAQERELVAWLQGAAEVIHARGPARAAGNRSGSLLTIADSSARAAGLGGALQRIQQEGSDGVRVRLESASFDSVVVWLETLARQHGISVDEMSLDRADAPGRINASLTLSRATP